MKYGGITLHRKFVSVACISFLLLLTGNILICNLGAEEAKKVPRYVAFAETEVEKPESSPENALPGFFTRAEEYLYTCLAEKQEIIREDDSEKSDSRIETRCRLTADGESSGRLLSPPKRRYSTPKQRNVCREGNRFEDPKIDRGGKFR